MSTMDSMLLFSRLLLAGVFVVAGLAKLFDRDGSRQAIIAFGVPARFATSFGVLLPLAELAVAVALVPVATAWWGAVGALLLLLLFIVAIAVNLARGRKPECRCFGQLQSTPVGWKTLARNGIFALIAGLIVLAGNEDPGLSVLDLLVNITVIQFVALFFVLTMLGFIAGVTWFMLHLLRQNGRLLVRLEALETRLSGTNADAIIAQTSPNLSAAGLPLGTQAPAFQLADVTGGIHALDNLRATGKPILLFFLDPGCGPCNTLLPKIEHWQQERQSTLVLAIISRGAVMANRQNQERHDLANLLLQKDQEVSKLYRAAGTPAAVLIRPDGRIGSPLAQGVSAIEELVLRTVEELDRANLPQQVPNALHVGDMAPSIALPDLAGRTRNLAEFQGKPALLLFWNPSCGFCRQMMEDLKKWEREQASDIPQLVIIASGSAEMNRAQDIRSPILLDQEFNLGRIYSARGTPSAVLIDATGRRQSEIAVGASAIFALARLGQTDAMQRVMEAGNAG